MPYRDFTTGPWKGLNQDENPLSLAPGELRDCENVTRYGEMLGTRPGTERPGSGEDYETALDETNPIRGAFEFRESFDEGRHLLTIADHTSNRPVFYEDDARLPAGTPPTINADQDYIWSFTMHNNLVWSTGGPPGKSQVQTESIWTWDGNTANGPTTRALTDKGSGTTLYPKFITSWNGYLLINGLQQATPTTANNPMVTRYCDFATDPTTDANWTDANTIGFSATRPGTDSYGGNFSTGFGAYRDNKGDFLLMLTNERLYAAKLAVGSDFAVTDAIANGCVHERAFVSLGLDSGEAIYVSGGRGPAIHSLRQSQEHGGKAEAFLSHKIRTFMDSLNLTRLHHTCGAYDQRNGIVVFAMSTGSNTTHDTLAVLDVGDASALTAETSRWYLWRLAPGAAAINHLLYARDANDKFFLYAFTHSGDVIRFTTDLYSEYNDTAYGIRIRTRDDTYGSLLASKTLGDIQVPVRSIGAVNASFRAIFDMGQRSGKTRTLRSIPKGSATWGSATWGVSTWASTFVNHADKIDGRGAGGTIGFEVSHSGKNEKVEIGPIQHQVLVSGESDDQAA